MGSNDPRRPCLEGCFFLLRGFGATHPSFSFLVGEALPDTQGGFIERCSRKLSELGSRLGFGVQGLGAPPGLPSARGAPKRAFRSKGSEIRLGGPGFISELRRQGLSEGPNGVSKCHLQRLWG